MSNATNYRPLVEEPRPELRLAHDDGRAAPRGVPLDIIVRLASRNGVLERSARANRVDDIRHLELADFVRVARSMGASWLQIGHSLGTTGRLACKEFGSTTLATARDRPH